MNLTSWVKSCFSRRGKALSLYRSGMGKANKRDYGGAIADYSAAIQAPNIPKDVKAMAIYNRTTLEESHNRRPSEPTLCALPSRAFRSCRKLSAGDRAVGRNRRILIRRELDLPAALGL